MREKRRLAISTNNLYHYDMPNISDYDSIGYDYTKYWNGRDYENMAEQRALKKLLPLKGNSILDVGGSFGRLAPVYAPEFKRAVILDYSQIALDQARELARVNNISNLETVKGDAYDMPFKDGEFDTVIMVRVMHHIEDSERLFRELHRVTKPGGTLILEMANKIHLKARLKHAIKGDFSFCKDKSPIRLGVSKEDPNKGIFYNFHPDETARLLENVGFRITDTLSVSNMRLPYAIKKHIAPSILMFADKMVTPLFSLMKLGPSIWFKAVKSATDER